MPMSRGLSDRARRLALGRYYFKVVVGAWMEHTGYDKWLMHDVLGYVLRPYIADSGVMWRESITDMSLKELADYIDDCRRFLAEFADIYVEDPKERP